MKLSCPDWLFFDVHNDEVEFSSTPASQMWMCRSSDPLMTYLPSSLMVARTWLVALVRPLYFATMVFSARLYIRIRESLVVISIRSCACPGTGKTEVTLRPLEFLPRALRAWMVV